MRSVSFKSLQREYLAAAVVWLKAIQVTVPKAMSQCSISARKRFKIIDHTTIKVKSSKIRKLQTRWPEWKLSPKITKFLIALLTFSLLLYVSSYDVLRDFCLLNLSSMEQWRHFKTQYCFSKEIFEPILLSEMDKFKESSICIVGMIRNSDHTLPALLNQLDNLSCLFKVSAILIYESNSDDNTPKILLKWKQNINKNNSMCSKFIDKNNYTQPIIMKKLLAPDKDPGDEFVFISRLDKYSAYRNYLLNEAMSLDIDFDYYAPIDLDIYALDIRRILSALHSSKQMDVSVMCVNGIARTGFLHDSLATIAFNEYDGGGDMNESNPLWFYYMNGIERSNIIYDNGPFTNVISCFGAMAFYNFEDVIHSKCKYMTTSDAIRRYSSLAEYYYVNEKKGDVGICEHITFNYCLYQYRLKLVIARDAYLYYGWNALPKHFRRLFSSSSNMQYFVKEESVFANVSFLNKDLMHLYNESDRIKKEKQKEQLQRYGQCEYNQDEESMNRNMDPGKIQKLNLTVRMLQVTFVMLSVFGLVLWCLHKRLRAIKIKINLFGHQREIFG